MMGNECELKKQQFHNDHMTKVESANRQWCDCLCVRQHTLIHSKRSRLENERKKTIRRIRSFNQLD